MEQSILYVGLDVHKDTIAVALAESGLGEDVREHGKIANTAAALKALTAKLAGKKKGLRFCYEAGPCGYGIQRQLIPAAQRADWYARRVGVAAAREINKISAARPPNKESDRRAAGMSAMGHEALQALRGVRLVAAVTLMAELGDITRFSNPRQLMAYLGLVPSEHSSGGRRRQGGITKAGNGAARRMLIEAAWSYRFPARISREQLLRQERLAKPIRDIAWKAQERFCRRYRALARAGKLPTVITAAIARELTGFIWAIAKQVQSAAS